MFRTRYAQARAENTTINITEKRAPTDESVKLLHELEKAARDKIDNAFKLSLTNCEVTVYSEQDMYADRTTYLMKINFNGKIVTAETQIGYQHATDYPYITDKITESISNAIAKDIFELAIPQLAEIFERHNRRF